MVICIFESTFKNSKCWLINDSSKISEKWSGLKSTLTSTKRDIWSYISSKDYSRISPLTKSHLNRYRWKSFVRKWKACACPAPHLFKDMVVTMFVQKSDKNSFEGYLISSADNVLITHPQMIFHDQRGFRHYMDLFNLTEADKASACLFSVYKK